MPAIPLLILGGLWMGHAAGGAIAAGTALSVGCAAGLTFGRARSRTMLKATAAIAAGTLVGLIAGRSEALFLAGAATGAAACACLALSDSRSPWAAQQGTIAYLVAGFRADTTVDIPAVVAATLLGGTVQIVIGVLLFGGVMTGRRLTPPPTGSACALKLPGGPRPVVCAGQAALCVVGSTVLVRGFGLDHGYWAPATALLVLRPTARETGTRGLERLCGTLVGSVLATLAATAGQEARWLLLAGATLCTGAAVALQKAPYVPLSAAVTASVVFLLSLGGIPALDNAEHRLAATLIGGVAAISVQLPAR